MFTKEQVNSVVKNEKWYKVMNVNEKDYIYKI